MQDCTRNDVTLASVSRHLRDLELQLTASGIGPDTLVPILATLAKARGMITRLTARDEYGVELDRDEV